MSIGERATSEELQVLLQIQISELVALAMRLSNDDDAEPDEPDEPAEPDEPDEPEAENGESESSTEFEADGLDEYSYTMSD